MKRCLNSCTGCDLSLFDEDQQTRQVNVAAVKARGCIVTTLKKKSYSQEKGTKKEKKVTSYQLDSNCDTDTELARKTRYRGGQQAAHNISTVL